MTATKNRHTGIDVPDASPSMPSVMFTAFTVPTMTKDANTKYSHSGIGITLLENGI